MPISLESHQQPPQKQPPSNAVLMARVLSYSLEDAQYFTDIHTYPPPWYAWTYIL